MRLILVTEADILQRMGLSQYLAELYDYRHYS